MSSPNQLPAYRRYLKARLQPFKRPAFWVSAVGLVLVLLFVWEYWNDPEWFKALGDNQGAESKATAPALASDELAARLADVDSSSVLLQELNRTSALTLPTLLNPESQTPSASEGLLAQTPQQAEAGASNLGSTVATGSGQQPSPTNPFSTSVQELLNTGPLSGSSLFPTLNPNRPAAAATAGTTSTSTLGLNGFNLGTNPSSTPVSALQNALNRLTPSAAPATNQTQTSVRSQLQVPTPTYQQPLTYPPTGQGVTGYGSSLVTPIQQNSYTNLVTPPTFTGVPAVPAAPVAPGTFNSAGQFSGGLNQTNSFANPGFNSTPSNPGVQPSQLTQPNFSVPRPVPGRYIGGGEINTFSNP